MTHSLVGQTAATQAHANKLDAELHTFLFLIERECHDTLAISHYFRENNLDRFITILAENGYTECRDLIRSNDHEFKRDIMDCVETGIDVEFQKWYKQHPDQQDPFDMFLIKYELGSRRFKQALKDNGLESLDDIDDDLDETMIEELISDSNMDASFTQKFKRAINDFKTDKYKPPHRNISNDTDDDKEKPRDISNEERRHLRKISLELCNDYVFCNNMCLIL